MKIIAQNKKARHDFFIEDTYEAGIELFGTEVKSLRAGKVNLKESYCTIKNGEIFIQGMNISHYEQGNIQNKDPLRDRKLLLHKREIFKLAQLRQRDGYSIVPTKLYFSDKGKIKLEIGIAKGKKLHDKRETLAKKDAQRQIDRNIKNFGR